MSMYNVGCGEKTASKTFFDGFTFLITRHFVTIKSAVATLSARTIDCSKGEVGPRERKAREALGFSRLESGVAGMVACGANR